MPRVVCTDPQLAGVGLTEAAAGAAGMGVRASRIVGARILAPEGADSIRTIVMAMKAGMTARALGETIFPYLMTVEA